MNTPQTPVIPTDHMNWSDVFSTIMKFLDDETMFTAVDVTNKAAEAVVRRGEVWNTPHRAVAAIVRNVMKHLIIPASYSHWQSGEIMVTTAAGTPVNTILYFSQHNDPLKYVAPTHINPVVSALSRQSTSVAAPVQSHVAVPPQVSKSQPRTAVVPQIVANAHWHAKVKVRSDGAVQIPAKAFLNTNMHYGSQCGLALHPNSISLSVGANGLPKSITQDTRVPKSLLVDAGLGTETEVLICAFSDKIVICKSY